MEAIPLSASNLRREFDKYLSTVPDSEQEINSARIIQKILMQDSIPQCKQLSCVGISIPAIQLSGDYFDFILDEENNRYWVLIGDVMGKGIPAAMLMVMLRSTVRCLVSTCETPSQLLSKANNLLLQDMTRMRAFSSLFCGVFDLKTHKFIYSTAGHPNPILLKHKEDKAQKLNAKGTIIGILKNRIYKDFSIDMSYGDMIVFCTDGVLEEMDQDNNQYGYTKLINLIETQEYKNLGMLIDDILNDLSLHSNKDHRDDVTIVAIRCEGGLNFETRDNFGSS